MHSPHLHGHVVNDFLWQEHDQEYEVLEADEQPYRRRAIGMQNIHREA